MKKNITFLIVFSLLTTIGCKEKKKTNANKVKETLATSTVNFEEKGLEFAFGTKAVLGKNLMETIKESGTEAAIKFCNVKAYPLTDSMSVVYNARIERVSDKPRNSDNKANEKELQHIATFKKAIVENQEVKPIIDEEKNSISFYYPITTNAMCLQCHGTPNKELNTQAYKTIKTLYPRDLAIGYNENEVRGIWHVKFNKQ